MISSLLLVFIAMEVLSYALSRTFLLHETGAGEAMRSTMARAARAIHRTSQTRITTKKASVELKIHHRNGALISASWMVMCVGVGVERGEERRLAANRAP